MCVWCGVSCGVMCVVCVCGACVWCGACVRYLGSGLRVGYTNGKNPLGEEMTGPGSVPGQPWIASTFLGPSLFSHLQVRESRPRVGRWLFYSVRLSAPRWVQSLAAQSSSSYPHYPMATPCSPGNPAQGLRFSHKLRYLRKSRTWAPDWGATIIGTMITDPGASRRVDRALERPLGSRVWGPGHSFH